MYRENPASVKSLVQPEVNRKYWGSGGKARALALPACRPGLQLGARRARTRTHFPFTAFGLCRSRYRGGIYSSLPPCAIHFDIQLRTVLLQSIELEARKQLLAVSLQKKFCQRRTYRETQSTRQSKSSLLLSQASMENFCCLQTKRLEVRGYWTLLFCLNAARTIFLG